jgi:hypothetical protein
MRAQRAVGAVVLGLGCMASQLACTPEVEVEVVAPPPPDTDRPPLPVGEGCGDSLDSAAIPLLPRTSNDEVLQLYSDLLGAPIDRSLFARWTPLAQVRGFDTMTESRVDAQTLEEQLRTTEAVAGLLVASPTVMADCPTPIAPEPVCAVHAAYDATSQFSNEQGRDCWSYLTSAGEVLRFAAADDRWIANDPGLFVWSTGLHPGINVDVVRRWTAPQDGLVTLQGTVADVDGGGGDGIIVDIRGPVSPGVQGTLFRAVIVNGGAAEAFNVTLNMRRGEVIDIEVQRGASNAFDSTALTATVGFTQAAPSTGLSWESCGQAVVDRVASRAFRRPLRADELADLKLVFDDVSASAVAAGQTGEFHEGLQATLQAVLLSPNVQYKPEFVPGGFDVAEDAFRRASRLALYFRSSFPDDELWAVASAGPLNDAALRAQAERLLAADGARFVDNFAGQWLDFRAPLTGVDTPMQSSMRQEAHDVFAAVLDEGQPAERLIRPGFTIVDAALADHYGLAVGGADDDGAPLRIDTAERGGIFTQGHFLTTSATGSDFKRVIHRGIFALNRTLCTSVPMLDPATREEIATSVEGIDPNLPLSERMEQHRNTSGRCLACHGQMDPLGLAMERYDENGLYRETYADGSTIDNGFDFNGTSVRNTDELATFVEGSADYHRCVAEKLLTFGLYRAPRDEEACVIDGLAGINDEGERDVTTTPSLHDVAIDAFLTSLHLTEQR